MPPQSEKEAMTRRRKMEICGSRRNKQTCERKIVYKAIVGEIQRNVEDASKVNGDRRCHASLEKERILNPRAIQYLTPDLVRSSKKNKRRIKEKKSPKTIESAKKLTRSRRIREADIRKFKLRHSQEDSLPPTGKKAYLEKKKIGFWGSQRRKWDRPASKKLRNPGN